MSELNFDLYSGSKAVIESFEDPEKQGNLILDPENSNMYVVNEQGTADVVNESYFADAVNNCLGSQGLEFASHYDPETGTHAPNSYDVYSIGSCTDTQIVIPETYKGCPVVGVRTGAFSGVQCDSIYIPDSVKYMGDSCFYDGKAIKIRIPDDTSSFSSSSLLGFEVRYIVCSSMNVSSDHFGARGVFEVCTEKEIFYDGDITDGIPTKYTARDQFNRVVHGTFGFVPSEPSDRQIELGILFESEADKPYISYVEDNAFENRTDITSVEMYNSIPVGVDVFRGCSNISHVGFFNDLSESSLKDTNVFKSKDSNPCLVGDHVNLRVDLTTDTYVFINKKSEIYITNSNPSGLYISNGGKLSTREEDLIRMINTVQFACADGEAVQPENIILDVRSLIIDYAMVGYLVNGTIKAYPLPTSPGSERNNTIYVSNSICIHNASSGNITSQTAPVFTQNEELKKIIFYNAKSSSTSPFILANVAATVESINNERDIYIYPAPGATQFNINLDNLWGTWQQNSTSTVNILFKGTANQIDSSCLSQFEDRGGGFYDYTSDNYVMSAVQYVSLHIDNNLEEVEECRIV